MMVSIFSSQIVRDIKRLVFMITKGTFSCQNGWKWRISEAIDQCNYNQDERNFIRYCLAIRKNKCNHRKHIGLRYFGCAWHIFCFTCGESRFCGVEEGCPSGNPSRGYLDKLAKKVDYV